MKYFYNLKKRIVNKLIEEGITLAIFKGCEHIVNFFDFFIKPEDFKENEHFQRLTEKVIFNISFSIFFFNFFLKNKRFCFYFNIAMEWAENGDLYSVVSERIKLYNNAIKGNPTLMAVFLIYFPNENSRKMHKSIRKCSPRWTSSR